MCTDTNKSTIEKKREERSNLQEDSPAARDREEERVGKGDFCEDGYHAEGDSDDKQQVRCAVEGAALDVERQQEALHCKRQRQEDLQPPAQM